MRKLGKKAHEILETVEAYYVCSGCYVSCSCSCNCGVAHFGTITFSSDYISRDSNRDSASYHVGNGMGKLLDNIFKIVCI